MIAAGKESRRFRGGCQKELKTVQRDPKTPKETNMKKLIALILFSASVAHANLVPLGSVTFTGDFTLNHLYDFNNREAQPFGWFGDHTVTGANGIFPALRPNRTDTERSRGIVVSQ